MGRCLQTAAKYDYMGNIQGRQVDWCRNILGGGGGIQRDKSLFLGVGGGEEGGGGGHLPSDHSLYGSGSKGTGESLLR